MSGRIMNGMPVPVTIGLIPIGYFRPLYYKSRFYIIGTVSSFHFISRGERESGGEGAWRVTCNLQKRPVFVKAKIVAILVGKDCKVLQWNKTPKASRAL